MKEQIQALGAAYAAALATAYAAENRAAEALNICEEVLRRARLAVAAAEATKEACSEPGATALSTEMASDSYYAAGEALSTLSMATEASLAARETLLAAEACSSLLAG